MPPSVSKSDLVCFSFVAGKQTTSFAPSSWAAQHRRVYPERNYIMQSMSSRCREEVQASRRKTCPGSTQLRFISYMAVPSSFVLNGEGNAMGIEIFPNNHIPVSCGTCYVVGESGTCICSDAYLDTVRTLVRIAQTI